MILVRIYPNSQMYLVYWTFFVSPFLLSYFSLAVKITDNIFEFSPSMTTLQVRGVIYIPH